MNRTALIASGVAGVLVLVGIGIAVLNRQDGHAMTPQEAKQRVVGFAESTIAHAAPDRSGTLEDAAGVPGSCHDRFGGTTDETSRTYRWVIDEVDEALADQIVTRTNAYWQERGIQVRRDDGPAGVNAILGSTDADGFGYKLIVNRNEGMAWVTIQTPCLDENPGNVAR